MQEQLVLSLQAIILILTGLGAGLAARRLTSRLLRASSRRLTGTPAALFGTRNVDGPVTVVLSSLVFWAVFVFFVAAATERLGLPVIGYVLATVGAYLPRVVAMVFVVMLGLLIADLARNAVTGAAAAARMSGASTLGRLAQLAILLATAIIAFEQLGITTTFVVVIIAIVLGGIFFGAALAFGLGARTTVSNILASYYVLKTFRVGQSVRVGEVQGRIIEITATSVLLATPAGQVVVPAKEFSERPSVMLAEE
jgi:small-conductance mechanosensitive channel